MSDRRFYGRNDWKARDARVDDMARQSSPREAFIHYSDDDHAEKIRTLRAQEAHMRDLQAFHMVNRGWSDIAYHYVVFQPYGNIPIARVFMGRRVTFVPAAQQDHNSRTLAICVVAGPGDPLKRNTRFAIEKIIDQYPSIRTVGGHRDVVATSCPGDLIYAQLGKIADACNIRTYK